MGIVQGLIISSVVAFLFYRSALGMLCSIGVVPFWLHRYRENRHNRLVNKKNVEFKELMQLVAASLQAGYSIERAFKQAEKEMYNLFSDDFVLKSSLHRLNGKVAVNIPVEQAFVEFAEEIDMEEAVTLADILSFAKRSGGDYGKHIRSASLKIEDKLAVELEIGTLTAEKRLELNVMTVMPLVILAYISVSSAEFIAPLYGSLTGIVVMTICLFVYAVMILLGEKIVNIQV